MRARGGSGLKHIFVLIFSQPKAGQPLADFFFIKYSQSFELNYKGDNKYMQK